MYLPVSMLQCCQSDGIYPHLAHVYIDLPSGYAFATDGHMALRVPIEPEGGEASGYCSQDAIQFAGRTDGHVRHLEDSTMVGDVCFPNPMPRDPGHTNVSPYPVKKIMALFAEARAGTLSLHLDARLLRTIAAALQPAEHASSREVIIGVTAARHAFFVTSWHAEQGRGAEALLMPLSPPTQ